MSMFNKKVLCLGTNSEITHTQTTELANTDFTLNHGLISDKKFVPENSGYYHTTVLDLSLGSIIALADYFDEIRMLDQPIDQWSNWKILMTTYNVMKNLESNKKNVYFRNNKNVQSIIFVDNLLLKNKSFCIHPWVHYTEDNGNLVACPRSGREPVVMGTNISEWGTHPNYQKLRNQMLEGQLVPNKCYGCYGYEEKGVESYRQYETREWFVKLGLENLQELENITNPLFYEIRLSNKCNLMCRSCNPEYSHLIQKESIKHNIIYKTKPITYSSIDAISIPTLTKHHRVYLTGGEPTVMIEVYNFMRQCIKEKRTDFEFSLGTNGEYFSDTFLELCSHFDNLNFSVSIDGFEKINDYWRHGSHWENVVRNMKLVKSKGHRLSINTVPGIYNVTNLHLLFEFLDQEFSDTSIYLQLNYFEHQSAFNHPNAELVVDSMKRCMKTNIYHSDGKSLASGINSLYHHYSKNPKFDKQLLKEFFVFNDKLDQVRNVKLIDYIPELEACRYLVND
jgi:sulfatase maturation enzyme AslB (radical SAM superfamily)